MEFIVKLCKRIAGDILKKYNDIKFDWLDVLVIVSMLCIFSIILFPTTRAPLENWIQAIKYIFFILIYKLVYLFIKEIIKKDLINFFLDNQSTLKKQFYIILFCIGFTMVCVSIICGATILLNLLIFIFQAEQIIFVKLILESLTVLTVLFLPIKIMMEFIKHYKKQVIDQIADCKFLSTWNTFIIPFAVLMIYYFVFIFCGKETADNVITNITKMISSANPNDLWGGLWGFPLSLLLFRTFTEYYSLVKDDVEPEELNKAQRETSEEQKILELLLKEIQEIKSEVSSVEAKVSNIEEQTKNVSQIKSKTNKFNNQVAKLSRKMQSKRDRDNQY